VKRFDKLINQLLSEAPAPATAPTKPKPSTVPGTPTKPSTPHPLTPTRPGIHPKPQAKNKKKGEEDNQEAVKTSKGPKVTYYKN
jgi:hypothetical protein